MNPRTASKTPRKWVRINQREISRFSLVHSSKPVLDYLKEACGIAKELMATAIFSQLDDPEIIVGSTTNALQPEEFAKILLAAQKGATIGVFPLSNYSERRIDRLLNSVPEEQVRLEGNLLEDLRKITDFCMDWRNKKTIEFDSQRLTTPITEVINPRYSISADMELLDLHTFYTLIRRISEIVPPDMLEFLSGPPPLDFDERYEKIERIVKKSQESNNVKECRALTRAFLDIIAPETRAELRKQSEIPERETIVVKEAAGTWMESEAPNAKTPKEERKYLIEHFPNLYRMMVRKTEEEKRQQKKSKELRKLARQLTKEGVPMEFYSGLINKGYTHIGGIIEAFLREGEEKEVEKGGEVRIKTFRRREDSGEEERLEITNEIVKEISGKLIKSKFGKAKDIEPHQKQLLDADKREINAFVSSYLNYLTEPKGERGVFLGENALFKERPIFVNDSEGWRAFVLQHGDSRIVVCVKPEENEIALLTVETHHDDYTKALINFTPSSIPKRVRITIDEDRVISEIVNGNNKN